MHSQNRHPIAAGDRVFDGTARCVDDATSDGDAITRSTNVALIGHIRADRQDTAGDECDNRNDSNDALSGDGRTSGLAGVELHDHWPAPPRSDGAILLLTDSRA